MNDEKDDLATDWETFGCFMNYLNIISWQMSPTLRALDECERTNHAECICPKEMENMADYLDQIKWNYDAMNAILWRNKNRKKVKFIRWASHILGVRKGE